MRFLRTISARRLLAVVGAVIVLGAGGAAIALAATGGGPTPPPKPLAQAVHDAVTARPVPGVTARITFTNKLIDSSSLQGSDPILTGATGRLWASSDGRLRLELQSDRGDAQITSDGSTLNVYDASSNTVYTATLPRDGGSGKAAQAPPTVAGIQKRLDEIVNQVDLSGARPTDVAGRPAYSVRIAPRHDGGLLGAAEIAWDSAHGVPLRAAVYAQGSSTPVLEIEATDISFGAVPASTFDVHPPANAKKVSLGALGGGSGQGAAGHGGQASAVTGPDAVAKKLPFTLAAPDQLVGLPRHDVRLLDWQGKPAALVTYGKGLGGIAVIEQASGTPSAGPGGRRLPLPTVSIDGATGQELDTALGTMVRFTRGGVSYIVIGSVPPAAADLAARGL
jgi:outer membrane lipoprotein-sorting protein